MTIEDLRRWRDAMPFVPFRIIPTDGPAIEVLNWWNMSLPYGATACVITEDAKHECSIINLSHIAAIEPTTPAPSS